MAKIKISIVRGIIGKKSRVTKKIIYKATDYRDFIFAPPGPTLYSNILPQTCRFLVKSGLNIVSRTKFNYAQLDEGYTQRSSVQPRGPGIRLSIATSPCWLRPYVPLTGAAKYELPSALESTQNAQAAHSANTSARITLAADNLVMVDPAKVAFYIL